MKRNDAKAPNINEGESESESKIYLESTSIPIPHYKELSTKETASKRKTTGRKCVNNGGKVFTHPCKVNFVCC